MSGNALRASGTLTSVTAVERARIATIIESAEGKARPEAALRLALHNDISAESAVELLRTLPAENPYLQAMDKFGPSGINSPQGATPQPGSRDARLSEIAQSMRMFNQSKGYGKRDRDD